VEKLKHSAATFIGCIGYLFYREDKLALKIERKVGEILRRK